MKRFWSYIENEQFAVGCTGQTVYVYDKSGTELARFKDLKYAYACAISPKGDCFAVKSTEGRLAVYSLETLSLIKKFRFSKVNHSQDDGSCFSSDGNYFINLERQGDEFHSGISVYNTEHFDETTQLLLDDGIVAEDIECSNGSYYLLGYIRSANQDQFFVGKFEENQIKERVYISRREHWFYKWYISLKKSGFTEQKYQWSCMEQDLQTLKKSEASLEKLWKEHWKP